MDKTLQILKDRQDIVFSEMASILAAMASPVRIKLIHFLSQAPLTVEVLSQKINQSVANTSMHLRKMLSERIVSVETLGQKRLYSLAPALLDFWEKFQDYSQALNPSLELKVDDVYGEINWNKSVSETRKLIAGNQLVFLDVRPDDEVLEFEENDFITHISQNELKIKLKSLPKRKTILVFCRGRMCALSAYAVNYLRENGFNVYRIKESWQAIKSEYLV
jgi:DNA-binding transcriptional ArsR family regulator